MKVLWLQDMIKSSDEFENGCIRMQYSAWVVTNMSDVLRNIFNLFIVWRYFSIHCLMTFVYVRCLLIHFVRSYEIKIKCTCQHSRHTITKSYLNHFHACNNLYKNNNVK